MLSVGLGSRPLVLWDALRRDGTKSHRLGPLRDRERCNLSVM